MSAKFASITAGLLARKGEAQPWNGLGAAQEVEKAPLAWRSEAAAPPPLLPVKDKSCSVRMSAHDYERLSIIAVKTGVTRQQLLKDALAQFLAGKARTLSCACLGACESRCED
ncbi:MAG TPA: hypothetical protein VGC16_06525 [Rhizomicrobium sp.]